MMKYRVKQHEQKSLAVKIKNLQEEAEKANIIRTTLLDVYENRKDEKYRCMSKDQVEDIFGPWDDISDIETSLVGAKKTVQAIKEMMIEENPDCPEK